MADGGYEWCETLVSCVRPWEVPSGLCGNQQDGMNDDSGSAAEGHDPAGLGLFGLWLAMAAGYAVVALIAGVAVLQSDWKRIIAAAAERSATQKETTLPNHPKNSSPPVHSLNRTDTGVLQDGSAQVQKEGSELNASLLVASRAGNLRIND